MILAQMNWGKDMVDIGVIIPQLEKYGGAERLLIECVARWQQKHKITIYSSTFNNKLLAEHGIKKRVTLVEISPYIEGPHSSILNCSLLPKIWEREIGRHDVYHTHLWPTHLIDRHPMVWYPHEPLRILHDLRHEESIDEYAGTVTRNVHMYPKYNYDGILDKYREAYLTTMDLFDKLGKPDRIVANSRFSADNLEDVYGREVKDVVYPGVNADEFIVLPAVSYTPGTHTTQTSSHPFRGFSDQNIIVTVGQLWRHKQINLIIEAVKLVENVQLYIVGDGPEKQNLQNIAARLAVDDRVFFLQGLTNLELQILYARSLAIAFTPVREPFGIVALEAMAAGKPLIATNEGGFTEVVDESCAFLVVPEPALIADKIAFLRDHKEIACSMGAAALVKAKQYTWDRMAQSLLEIIEDTYEKSARIGKSVQAGQAEEEDTLFGIQYYLWYDNGFGSRHWNDNSSFGGVTDKPAIGCYGSSRGTTIERHFKLMESIGLDFCIMNLHIDGNGVNPYELAAIENVFSIASRGETLMKLAVQVCPAGCRRPHFVQALEMIQKDFFKNPQYFHSHGKPVIYIFWTGELDGRRNWINVMKNATEGCLRIASSLRTYDLNTEVRNSYGLFDGFSLFSPLELSNPKKWKKIWLEAYEGSQCGNKGLRIVTICPGYDDSHLTDLRRSKNPYRRIPRESGKTYKKTIDFALSVEPKPNQVIVSTFNEFHENTHIEPSLKNDSLYIDMTRDFIRAGRELWNKKKS
jgi:glycosyltransferase involved in cell wall biosynthesis